MDLSDNTDVPVVTTLVTDFFVVCALLGDTRKVRADIRGQVVRMNVRGRIAFLVVADTTGEVQVVGMRDRVSDETWARIRHCKVAARCAVTGSAFRTERGVLSVLVDEFGPSRAPTDTATSWHRVSRYGRVGRRIFLSRARRICGEFFASHGFLEVEPALIISSWESPGIEPLRVVHGGFGPPTFLATSPHPQLVEAADVMDQKRVFALGRCFANSVLDRHSGMESLVLGAIMRDTTRAEVVALMKSCVRRLASDQTLQSRSTDHDEVAWQEVSGEEVVDFARRVEEPTIQYIRMFPSRSPTAQTAPAVSVVRALWPPDLLLAEARLEAAQPNSRSNQVAVSVYVERFLSLFHDISLRDLAQPGPS